MALPCNQKPLALPRGCTPPRPLSPLRYLNQHHHAQPATADGSPPASLRSFFGPLTDTLRDYLGGHYTANPADHAWTIAKATGDAPLPLHSPPLGHSGGSLNVAARHIPLTLYLHHHGLHLPDPKLSPPRAAAPAPEAWAETAPEEVADYLRRTCRGFDTAFGLQKGAPYPLSALVYPAHPPLAHS